MSLPQNIHLCAENQWNVEKKLVLTSQTIKTNLLTLPNGLALFIESLPNLLAWFGHSKHLSLPQNIHLVQWFLIFFGRLNTSEFRWPPTEPLMHCNGNWILIKINCISAYGHTHNINGTSVLVLWKLEVVYGELFLLGSPAIRRRRCRGRFFSTSSHQLAWRKPARINTWSRMRPACSKQF